jgi:hypothetical protein
MQKRFILFVDRGFVYSSCMLYFYFHALGIIMKLNGYL